MRINLTLAGGGRKRSGKAATPAMLPPIMAAVAPPKVAAPTPKPVQTPAPVQAPAPAKVFDPATGGNVNAALTPAQTAAKAKRRKGAENIRNVGGGRGAEIENAVRGLKQLTGQ
jgi:hypothetical protein